MTLYSFQEVALRAEKSGKCGCGKRRTRREKFWQTLNPFNKNAEGEPKTAQEIRVELAEKIQAWRAEPITCDDCRHDAALHPEPSTEKEGEHG